MTLNDEKLDRLSQLINAYLEGQGFTHLLYTEVAGIVRMIKRGEYINTIVTYFQDVTEVCEAEKFETQLDRDEKNEFKSKFTKWVSRNNADLLTNATRAIRMDKEDVRDILHFITLNMDKIEVQP